MVTRRRFFKLSGLSAALVSLPPGFAEAAGFLSRDETPQSISPVMQQLSTYMGAASSRALPDEVVEKAKQHILDTFAAMISGSGLPPGRAALDFARSYGGKEIATVVASNIVCGPIEAAFANGVLAHHDEHGRPRLPGPDSPQHPRHRCLFRRGRRRRLCREPQRPENAAAARLHRATNLRHRRLVARCRAHGKVLPLRW